MALHPDPGDGRPSPGVPAAPEPPTLPAAHADLTPPPLPCASDPMARRLAAMEGDLRLLRRSSSGAPLWLVLAIALLLFCQAIQFGLLIALLVRTLNATEPAPVDAATLPSDVVEPEEAPSDVVEPGPPPDAPVAPPDAASVALEERKATARTASSTSDTATVRVLGGDGYLVGKSGRVAPGAVPPGRYRVYAEAEKGTGFESLGRFTLAAGDTLTIRCGFGTCQVSK